MTILDLSVDELLTTTRAVRKRLDFSRPVDIDVVKECLEIALQAPSGSNAQNWHFLIVTDFDKKKKLADLYRRAWDAYLNMPGSVPQLYQDDPVLGPVQQRVMSSGEYLTHHLEEAPVFVIPCVEARVEAVEAPMAVLFQASTYASIIPAAWSFMLAARSRGLGTCWTTLHLLYEKEAADILGIPLEKVTQVALIPVAYTKGTKFRSAARKPLGDVLHLEAW
jgi:nitroreductase